MSKELIERLRIAHNHGWASICGEAADRIEALEAELNAARRPRGICSLGVGCNDAGVCYADAHGEGMMCGVPDAAPVPAKVPDDLISAVDRLLMVSRYCVEDQWLGDGSDPWEDVRRELSAAKEAK
jgi:hypothetical protein